MTTDTTVRHVVGSDFGGTQLSVMVNLNGKDTVVSLPSDLPSMDAAITCVTERYGAPEVMVIGAAGAPEHDGSIKLTNRKAWPAFYPDTVGDAIGCKIIVVNDMVIKAAGLPETEVEVLHSGIRVHDGIKVVVTVSTGVGNGTRLADGTITSSEGGHTTWQPSSELEDKVLAQLRKHLKTRIVSVEQVIAGRYFLNLYDALVGCGYALQKVEDRRFIEDCRATGTDIGPAIVAIALSQGQYPEAFVKYFMEIIGSILGQYLRNLALSTLPKGGIYLTGGVMQPTVLRYLQVMTPLREAFLGGTEHNGWLREVPIYLVTDPHLGAKGAYKLAEQARGN